MARIFVPNGAIYSNENLPKCIEKLPKQNQKFLKYSKKWPKASKFLPKLLNFVKCCHTAFSLSNKLYVFGCYLILQSSYLWMLQNIRRSKHYDATCDW